MTSFTAYTGTLLPIVPTSIIPVFAWGATILEIILGVMLLIGYKLRIVSLASGILLLIFAVSMMFSLSFKAPLDYSVLSAAACAFLLYKCS